MQLITIIIKRTIRVVFDSICEFEGVSLNKVLLPGPDLMNNLIGVLMRFRKENIAVVLHKVVSNSVEVMEAFSAEDRTKDVLDLDLRHDSLPVQRSLGVFWDLETDAFTFKVSLPEKPFTRRGVLSIVNSVYDPLGFAVPVMLEGRKILQQLVQMGEWTKENNTPLAWDDPLPTVMINRWTRWRDSRRVAEPFRASLLPP